MSASFANADLPHRVASFQVAQRLGAGCSLCVPGAGAAIVVMTLLGCGGTGLGGIGQLADMQSVRTAAMGRVDSRGPGQVGGAKAWSAGRHPCGRADPTQIRDLGGSGQQPWAYTRAGPFPSPGWLPAGCSSLRMILGLILDEPANGLAGPPGRASRPLRAGE